MLGDGGNVLEGSESPVRAVVVTCVVACGMCVGGRSRSASTTDAAWEPRGRAGNVSGSMWADHE